MTRRSTLSVLAGAIFAVIFAYLLAVPANTHPPAVTWTLGPLARAAMAVLLFREVFPRMISGRVGDGPAPERPPSGTRLAAARGCSGRIGWLRFDNTLGVEVFADRIVLRPWFMGSRTIMTSEITSMTGTLMKLTIEHRSAEVRSPVKLGLPGQSEVRLAIESVSRRPLME
jgi:hypothetical protein